ncbi:uncharacterized protein [Triticum aestivum]|uniref:uncharacterized protein isoform X2 n=1 Tax=Triticum aestivum TaxID=4565 RepID=UPI001D0050F5|nr:uncharacterized protein LOC123072711 isoform X2 [Triticum aestivum]
MDEGIIALERIFDGGSKPTDLKLSALQSITGNFSQERIVGTGGFGTVYKGVLRNGEVAVKRIKNNHTIDEKLFRREVNSLLHVSHKNIVRFLGFCSHTEHKAFENEGSRDYIYAEDRERIICFEYINNGSLEKYITDELRGLQWDTRYFIIKGICDGLHYLHREKQIIHMDLKPANILLDHNMVAKITDFGLSRMEENAQTKSTTRVFTSGYAAPEYIDEGKMSVKYDVYSLGIIIIELVTGDRRIPDIRNVLRRWRHRLHKSGKETPLKYRQIDKLIKIGLLCQEKDPCKRPSISDIIYVINELESTDRKISNANESTIGRISPYSEDDMLGVEPLELRFPFELNSQISCSLELTNETNAFIAFNIQTTSPLPYRIQPNKDIVAPQSKYSVNIALQPLDKTPQDNYTGYFIIWSTKVNGDLITEDITEDIFKREEGKLVDEVNLTITYKAEESQVDVSVGSPIISDMRDMHGPQVSNVLSTEADSKTSASTSDEEIQFDPPELRFPLVPDKKVLSSVKVINNTELYISIALSSPEGNSAAYSQSCPRSIMPPRSTQWLTVIREEKENEQWFKQWLKQWLDDQVSVWYAIVAEDIKVSDLDWKDYNEYKKLPVVLTKISSPAGTSTSGDEVIRLDHPARLVFPRNHTGLSTINIVNLTDYYVGFHLFIMPGRDEAVTYHLVTEVGILAPRSDQRLVVARLINEKETQDTQYNDDKLFIWNAIVSEGVKVSDLDFQGTTTSSLYGMPLSLEIELSMELPLILTKTSSTELVQFDPPELSFPLLPNQIVLSSTNIVNITDQYIGFGVCTKESNSAWYNANPSQGILPPLSTQVILVKRIAKGKEPEDTECKGKFLVWSGIVTEDPKARDIDNMSETKCTKLPIVLTQTSSSISEELIQFDPPELHFPTLPKKKVLSSIKIVNLTDYNVGFKTYSRPTNRAWYHTEPPGGILPPRSTQKLMVTREEKKDALKYKQFNEKYFVWTGILSEGVKDSEPSDYTDEQESKEVPIVLDKISSLTSDELIQLDPAELCIPHLPNKQIKFIVNVGNTTYFYVAFNVYVISRNATRDKESISKGILEPRSTNRQMLHWTIDETDDIFVWSRVVTEGVESIDITGYMVEEESKKLPFIIVNKASPTCSSKELIQFDPLELSLPLMPNKPLVFSVNVVNSTDYYVGFRTHNLETNVALYYPYRCGAVMPPGSTQRLVVKRVPKKKEDMQCQDDKFLVWSCLVSEGTKAIDLYDWPKYEGGKELPIVYTNMTSSLCNSDELIQFDPPHLQFTFLSNMRASMLRLLKIVNVTDHTVGFNTLSRKENSASYRIEPHAGILSPQSTKVIKVRRTLKEYETEDMQCTDKLFVWNGCDSRCQR